MLESIIYLFGNYKKMTSKMKAELTIEFQNLNSINIFYDCYKLIIELGYVETTGFSKLIFLVMYMGNFNDVQLLLKFIERILFVNLCLVER